MIEGVIEQVGKQLKLYERGWVIVKFAFLFVILLVFMGFPAHAQTYKWVDEKGTVHLTDDFSNIPEKYRSIAEVQKSPKEVSVPKKEVEPASVPAPQKASEPKGLEVALKMKGEVSVTEVILNGRDKHEFIVDTGASFTSISRKMARDLEITIDESTPWLPISTASDLVFKPLVTVRSVRVGEAEVKNVDVLIGDMPGDNRGLLGNSFLKNFRVVFDPINGKMTLFPLEGEPSPDRPGGYGKDYWVGRFQFYHNILEELMQLKTEYEKASSSGVKILRIKSAIKYFENQLSDLERKASLAGVPRNWRQ